MKTNESISTLDAMVLLKKGETVLLCDHVESGGNFVRTYLSPTGNKVLLCMQCDALPGEANVPLNEVVIERDVRAMLLAEEGA